MKRTIKISKFEQIHSIPTTAIKVSDNEIRFDFHSPNLIVFDLSSITARREDHAINLYSPLVPTPLSKGEVFEQLYLWAKELFNYDH
ncbi:hypothetical protein FAZ19_10000 [Sphingobacterium alkalisoli]|uniref:Uncharacterized protein n=1 Tax=Sphingobacterium alkalisoli TaxID=1874115 RepID=A0A4U0H1Y4_9SPHI|nr:hypothetical protein [Sphingobacterium alkalisoli]TJY65466.1 hypothetical protein FAZ19_10000 [Sphingobacterium alkalisoli]GGH20282.1 hypothetical protein GCM10011418_25360 [Sphingobacterium alkalisoli]